jgi:molecular chaperone GrpE
MNADHDKTNGAPQAEDPAVETAAAEPVAEAAAPEGGEAARLREEVASLKDQLLRAVAETENVRRRAERDREDTAKYAVSKFAKDVLAVADNLRRALEAVPADQRGGEGALEGLLVGVEATERQLLAAMERAGIQRMEALGQPFDPNFHQVMFEVEASGKPGGTIVQVLQDGYTVHGRLLREAMVGVAKGEPQQQGHVDTSA